jgi:hypothetical protein
MEGAYSLVRKLRDIDHDAFEKASNRAANSGALPGQ